MSYLDPPASFSSRFHVRNQQRRKTPEDEALEKHIHGSLFPFESQPFNNCYPVQLPSRKVKSYARGTFQTGTDSWGYLFATPFMHNNPGAGYLSYSAGGAFAYDSGTNPSNVTLTNSPFDSGVFASSGILGRVSSCSIRVRNITPMLTRGGTLYALKSPNDDVLSVTAGFNDLIGDLDHTGDSIRCDTSGNEWQTLSWCPRDSDQMEYAPSPLPLTMSGAVMIRPLTFVAQAPGAANVQTYEWEWVTHFDVTAYSNSNQSIVGATRGIAHLQVSKANQIITDLHKQPKIIKNPASSQVAGFVADMIAAGQGAAEIVGAASDLVDRTAAIAPRVIASARALGAWL